MTTTEQVITGIDEQYSLVMPEICPTDRLHEWPSENLFRYEQAIVQHAHAVLGGHVPGDEQDRLTAGLRTLSQLDRWITDVEGDIAESEFYDEVDAEDVELKLSQAGTPEQQQLMTKLGNLSAQGSLVEMVPAITSAYPRTPDDSKEFTYGDGLAWRRGLTHHLLFALLSGVTQTSDGQVRQGVSHTVQIKLSNGHKPIQGKLVGVDVTPEGQAVALVNAGQDRNEIPLSEVKKLSVRAEVPTALAA